MTYLGSRVLSLPTTRVTQKLGPSRCFLLCESWAVSWAQNIFYILTRQKISLELPAVTVLWQTAGQPRAEGDLCLDPRDFPAADESPALWVLQLMGLEPWLLPECCCLIASGKTAGITCNLWWPGWFRLSDLCFCLYHFLCARSSLKMHSRVSFSGWAPSWNLADSHVQKSVKIVLEFIHV